MHPLINTHRQEIAELARRYGVRRLEVSGSIRRDDFDESSSDIDIVVEFEPRSGGGGFRQYFDLKAKLETPWEGATGPRTPEGKARSAKSGSRRA